MKTNWFMTLSFVAGNFLPCTWENTSISLFPLLVMVRGIERVIKVSSEETAQVFSLTQDTAPLGSCSVGVTRHKVVRIQQSVLFLRIPCILMCEIRGRNAEYVSFLAYCGFGASLVFLCFTTFFIGWDPTLACKVLNGTVGELWCKKCSWTALLCMISIPVKNWGFKIQLEFNFIFSICWHSTYQGSWLEVK